MADEDKRQYKPVHERSREEIEGMLQSAIPEQMGKALWSATYYDPDWRWVQQQCLQCLSHADLWVRRNAATCLGLLAVFHKQLDVHVVLPALHKAAAEPELMPWVEDSLSDIRHNIKLQ